MFTATFNPITSAAAFAQSAIDAASRGADSTLQFVPGEYRSYVRDFNESYFSIVRANVSTVSNLISQAQACFTK